MKVIGRSLSDKTFAQDFIDNTQIQTTVISLNPAPVVPYPQLPTDPVT